LAAGSLVVAAAAAASMCVYWLTLAPTAFAMDSAELAAAAHSLGLAHAPGYPVYLVIAHLFTRLPIGDVAFRVNLLSAMAGAASVGFLAAHLSRSPGNNLVALAAALGLGFSYHAWAVSVAAEVYTLQALLLMAILMLAWDWRARGGPGRLTLVAGLMGLGLANNPATLLWWPGLFLLLWTSSYRVHLGKSDAVRIAAALTLGAAPVAYIPLRSAADPVFAYVGWYDVNADFVHPDLTRPLNLLGYLSGQPFAAFFPSLDPGPSLAAGLELFGHLWALMLGVGLPLGCVGFARLLRSDRTWALGLLAVGGAHAAFFAGYRAGDRALMLLPTFLVWAIFVAHGLDTALHPIDRRWHGIALLLPAALLMANWSYVDLSGSDQAVRLARARLESAAPDSVYIAPWGEAAVMHYLQTVEGTAGQVTVVNSFFVDDATLDPLIRTAWLQGRPVYTSQADLLPPVFAVQNAGWSYLVVADLGGQDE
jgi:hypothetical protein